MYFRIIALTACGGKRISGYTVLKNVATNPLIIAAVTGLVMLLAGFSLPGVIAVPLSKLSGAATPLALFILGASIDLQKAKSNVRFLSVAVLARLLLLPLLFISLAALIGIRDVSLAAIIALFASPTAVSKLFHGAETRRQCTVCRRAGGVYHCVFPVLRYFFGCLCLRFSVC